MDNAALPISFLRTTPKGEDSEVSRAVAVEAPVSVEFNGIGYAVMMATPADLEDFATGFSLSERLVDNAGEIVAIDHHHSAAGHILRISLAASRSDTLLARVRHRVSDSSCGLCGIENLEQALRPLPRVTAASEVGDAAIFEAIGRLRGMQPLNRETGAVHAAARCASDGTVISVREDVGRHNAFDKLVGSMARANEGWAGGFALLSSRCSYELVEKAALSNCPMLVTISAPTTLAVERAREAGIRLVVLARADAILTVSP
ncbi:formate dehydrogenase accessory sulfurtransferase FdhD [Sphingomonas sp. QA11]|uniref:formate dehydrogenase accessory sulfurtransferase FdhD n=1 Tax=Sphingomonas sp. QA11 TaxID=2950605 RepID=UPI00234A5D10|nr:formate dehydrogenase accessory sulfurtransferase FdhD [Sphingomonas sp. QA11]WCM28487.1 formate dehydrogenase accessory sulfurtransferase FdhD [Sphingomonas sp. QA11]